MSSQQSQLGHILEQVRKLDAPTRRLLVEHIKSMADDVEPIADAEDAELWTKEELAHLINPTPMTGKEIAEAGLLGGWQDMGIEDSVAWINQQKEQRRKNTCGSGTA